MEEPYKTLLELFPDDKRRKPDKEFNFMNSSRNGVKKSKMDVPYDENDVNTVQSRNRAKSSKKTPSKNTKAMSTTSKSKGTPSKNSKKKDIIDVDSTPLTPSKALTPRKQFVRNRSSPSVKEISTTIKVENSGDIDIFEDLDSQLSFDDKIDPVLSDNNLDDISSSSSLSYDKDSMAEEVSGNSSSTPVPDTKKIGVTTITPKKSPYKKDQEKILKEEAKKWAQLDRFVLSEEVIIDKSELSTPIKSTPMKRNIVWNDDFLAHELSGNEIKNIKKNVLLNQLKKMSKEEGDQVLDRMKRQYEKKKRKRSEDDSHLHNFDSSMEDSGSLKDWQSDIESSDMEYSQ